MVDAFHTNPIDAYAPRWFRVGAAIDVAYLWDARAELFARMSQHDERTWCQIHGARLPTVEEVDLVRRAATRLLIPVTLPTAAMTRAAGVDTKDPIAINAFRSRHMAERSWSEEHDRQVAAQGVTGPDPGELVFNLGKHWTREDGVEKGWYVPNRAIYGGPEGPGYVQGGTRPTHGTDQIDYSRIALVVRDVRPSWFDRLKEETDEILDGLAKKYRAAVASGPDGLGARAVAWSQTRIGLHEIPGPVHEAEIVAWGKLCRRGGVYLGRALEGDRPGTVDLWTGGAKPVSAANDEEAWCAKFASAALAEALEVGEAPPHGLRVSVAELVRDARALGSWRDVSTGYRPRIGDLAIFSRAGADPRQGGTGHVARVVVPPSILGEYMTIGGNESPGPGRVHRTARTLGDPSLVGWIAYP